MRLGLACVMAMVVGCASSGTQLCDNGTTCPTNTTCAVAGELTFCVSADQLAQCQGKADGDPCAQAADEMPTHTCHAGACFANACGNRLTDIGESCDDGNQQSGDGCSGDCVSNETCGNGVIDAIAFEQCDDANRISHDGCDSQCRLETAQWSKIGDVGMPLLQDAAIAYDEARGVVVMFGGIDANGAYSGDTYLWNGRNWGLATTLVAPSPRYGSSMAYDSKRHRVVLFGGMTEQGVSSDVWEWDGTDWTFVPTGDGPTACFDAMMTYDSNHGRVVLFSGDTNTSLSVAPGHLWLDDMWTWDGTQWNRPAAGGPPARGGGSMAYDPKRNRLVVYGGYGSYSGSPGAYQTTTWEYDGSTWSPSSATAPSAANKIKLAWDPSIQKIVMVGGETTTGTPSPYVFAYDGTSWTQIANVPELARTHHVLVSDTTRQKLMVWGGTNQTYGAKVYEGGGSSWANVTVPGAPSSSNGSATDTSRGRIVTLDDAGVTWEHDGVAWGRRVGAAPSPRSGAAVVYDEQRKEVILFGGQTADVNQFELGDTWRYTAAGWQQLAVTGGPSARHDSAIAYDAERKRVVLFGGRRGSNPSFGDTWLWDGTSWTQATPALSPGARTHAAMAYDRDRKSVVMFGGHDPGGGSDQITWLWDGSNWSMYYDVSRPHPSPRHGLSMAWDAVRHQVVLFGGQLPGVSGTSSLLQDTWEYGLHRIAGKDVLGWQLVSSSTPPVNRYGATAASDPRGAGIILLGGQLTTQLAYDTWRLRWEGPTDSEVCRDATLDLDTDGQTTCKDGDCAAVCSGCGDGTCNTAFETCRLCPQDCGMCTAVCGDFHCDAGESSASCPGDCP